MKTKDTQPHPSQDDTPRQAQASHGDSQHRSKKAGHVTRIGTGQDQQSSRNRGAGARSKP
ncbi:hypothetical protein SB816_08215 [Achromobacter sp. SIMBA_011]|uniref:hypothetical protein n=1 Tax=Achromobacter TaxID=222 RepID=UPI0006C27608|nr:hypothetical protein [Achromobacter dolens]CAB3699783.1 hypothetical protein LMG26840_05254 [Achromobacter dolens]CUJ49234.1 Uncharacterised protein [Achromobacter dolens]